MKIFSELRLKLRFILWPTIWATIILYITFHMIQGERGLIAFMQIHGEVLAAKKTQQILISKKKSLQNCEHCTPFGSILGPFGQFGYHFGSIL